MIIEPNKLQELDTANQETLKLEDGQLKSLERLRDAQRSFMKFNESIGKRKGRKNMNSVYIIDDDNMPNGMLLQRKTFWKYFCLTNWMPIWQSRKRWRRSGQAAGKKKAMHGRPFTEF